MILRVTYITSVYALVSPLVWAIRETYNVADAGRICLFVFRLCSLLFISPPKSVAKKYPQTFHKNHVELPLCV